MAKLSFKWYYITNPASYKTGDTITDAMLSPLVDSESKQITTDEPKLIIPKGSANDGKHIVCKLVISDTGYESNDTLSDATNSIKKIDVTPTANTSAIPKSQTETIKVGTVLTAIGIEGAGEGFSLSFSPTLLAEYEYDSAGYKISYATISKLEYCWYRIENNTLSDDQWKPIENATSQLYNVAPDDLGKYLRVGYTITLDNGEDFTLVTNPVYCDVITSNSEVTKVIKGDIALTTPILLNSSPSYGETVTVGSIVVTPSATDDNVYYQWFKENGDGTSTPLTDEIVGSDENNVKSYTIGNTYNQSGGGTYDTATVGDKIYCKVSIKNVDGYEDTSKTTSSTSEISVINVSLANVFEFGTTTLLKVGETLTVTPNTTDTLTYDPSINGQTTSIKDGLKYKWGYADDTEFTNKKYIEGETSNTFEITPSTVNKYVFCEVYIDGITDNIHFKLVNNTQTIVTSGAIATSNLTGKVTIYGSTLVGEELYAISNNLVKDSDIRYEWYYSPSGEMFTSLDSLSQEGWGKITSTDETFRTINKTAKDDISDNNSDKSASITVPTNIVGKNIWCIVYVKHDGYTVGNGSLADGDTLIINDNTDAGTQENKQGDVVAIKVTPSLTVTPNPTQTSYRIDDEFTVNLSIASVEGTHSMTTKIKSATFNIYRDSKDNDILTNIEDIVKLSNPSLVSATTLQTYKATESDVNCRLYLVVSDIHYQDDVNFATATGYDRVWCYVETIGKGSFTITDLSLTGSNYYGQVLTAHYEVKDERGNIVQSN